MWRSWSSSTRFSPSASMGKWLLREAAYLATACCRFDRRFSPSLRSVHYLHMCRLLFSAEKAVTFSMCTLYRHLASKVHPGLFTKNHSSYCSLLHPRPIRCCLLMDVEGPVLAGLCGQQLPWSHVVERGRHCPSSLCPNREKF